MQNTHFDANERLNFFVGWWIGITLICIVFTEILYFSNLIIKGYGDGGGSVIILIFAPLGPGATASNFGLIPLNAWFGLFGICYVLSMILFINVWCRSKLWTENRSIILLIIWCILGIIPFYF